MISLNWVSFFVVLVFYIHIISVSISLYIHRNLGHCSVEFHKYLEKLFQIVLWLTFGLPHNSSIAHHRLHHKYADQKDNDPAEVPIFQKKFYFYFKKPLYLFFIFTLFSRVIPIPTGKLFKNFKIQPQEKTDIVFTKGKNIINKPSIHVWWNNHSKLGAWLFILLNVLMFGWVGWIMVAVLSFSLTYLGVIYIDGFVHLFGYRNYNTKDHSKNFTAWALLTGEELHNNHHAYPGRANFAHRWFEFDIGYFYICIFKLLGLAKVKQ